MTEKETIKKEIEEILKEFDRLFVKDNGEDIEPSFNDASDVSSVKNFIKEKLEIGRERIINNIMYCVTSKWGVHRCYNLKTEAEKNAKKNSHPKAEIYLQVHKCRVNVTYLDLK